MARFQRHFVVSQFYASGMIPIFYNSDIEVCKRAIEACNAAEIYVFEFTNRGDFAHEVFGQLVKWASAHYPNVILGAGSIMDPATAALYLQLGANFIVSPILNPEMAKVCNRRKVSWSPGCGSLTEISFAEELGADIVKIFPGEQVGGPAFIKAVKGPMPWSSIMPTGGVDTTEESLKQWIGAGAYCVGMGSKVFTKELLEPKNFEELVSKLKYVKVTIDQLRG